MSFGTMLAMRAVAHARRNDIGVLRTTTVWENRPARAPLRRLRFHAPPPAEAFWSITVATTMPPCRLGPVSLRLPP